MSGKRFCNASDLEPRPVKLSYPFDPSGPSLMNHNRALHNPPVAVPHSGLPSHQSEAIESDYLLVCQAHSQTLMDGRWRFSLEAADGELVLEAEDEEVGDLNRLTLLAAVRGLEALEGPSAVTLLSNNRYLIRSLSNSLPRWRQNGFRWEHFGRRIDVQHADLWRRIDRALEIHRVQACLVSTCLVSHGGTDLSPLATAGTPSQPADGRMQQDSRSGPDGLDRAPRDRPAGQQRGVVPAPSARLRSLLARDAAEESQGGQARKPQSRDLEPQRIPARRRGRFTAEDLDI